MFGGGGGVDNWGLAVEMHSKASLMLGTEADTVAGSDVLS
jgi:hypothetical protein